MRLVYCIKCEDVFKLEYEARSCKCGACAGANIEDTSNPAIFGEQAVIVGFDSISWPNAIKKHLLSDPSIDINTQAFILSIKNRDSAAISKEKQEYALNDAELSKLYSYIEHEDSDKLVGGGTPAMIYSELLRKVYGTTVVFKAYCSILSGSIDLKRLQLKKVATENIVLSFSRFCGDNSDAIYSAGLAEEMFTEFRRHFNDTDCAYHITCFLPYFLPEHSISFLNSFRPKPSWFEKILDESIRDIEEWHNSKYHK